MSTSWRPSFRGLAYLASANFMGRVLIFLAHFIQSFFSYQMILLYGAHLDSQILLFFQAVFMIPVFLLGSLVFIGIEKESFNLVLYPTLMLLFVVLLRYGAEIALLIIHWTDHQLDQAPPLIFNFTLDLFCIAILLLYVYFALTSAPIAPTPPGCPEAPPLNSYSNNHKPTSGDEVTLESNEAKRKKPPAPPPEGFGAPPPRPPPSPKFNYALRRNIGHLPPDAPERALLEELNEQKKRNSQILQEEAEEESEPVGIMRVKTQSLKVYDTEPKRRSLVLETDLDVDGPSKEESEVEERKGVEVEGTSSSAEVEEGKKEVEEEEESEYEYEYVTEEEEEEEEKEVTVTLPRPKPEVKEEEEEPPTSSATKSFKTTAV